MVKVASTVAIGALSLPLLASALPCPIAENDALNRGLTVDVVREFDGLDDLDVRGLWQTVKNDAKKVGHELKEVATSPVGQLAAKTAMTALILRDPELYAELDARGFWKNVKQDEKKFGHELNELTACPEGIRAAKAGMKLVARNPEFFADLEARGFWKNVKQDAKKLGHEFKEVATSPLGKAAAKSAMKALLARDHEMFEELVARDGGFWQNVKQGAENVGHKVGDFLNSPFGSTVSQVVLQHGLDKYGGSKESATKSTKAPAEPVKEREIVDLDELFSRGVVWQTVKDDVKKGVHLLMYGLTKP